MEAQQESPQDFALAVDIGGTKAAFALVNTYGRLLTPLEKHYVPFKVDGAADPDGLLALLQPYVKQAQYLPGRFRGIGLSLCGNIDLETGLAVLVPNLHWRYLPFGEMVLKAFSTPVFAATDVRMALLAEILWGVARGVKHTAWATVGTGYGGYLYLDGKLYGGSHGYAGNFGHTTWDEIHGELCGCGKRGCFETFVAGPAIAAQGQRASDSGESPVLRRLAGEGRVTTADVFSAEAQGDMAAQKIIENIIRLISINLAGVVNTLDLAMIVMGGGVVHASPTFIQRINTRIRDFLMTEEAKRELQVVKESFENSALLGAAADVFLRSRALPQEAAVRISTDREET
ncbi:MAG TPA: ROK family protein [Anaerolineales bacterium]|nr:ROK family protein [Anaerolineales bacterium]